jgi:hypothetical protein
VISIDTSEAAKCFHRTIVSPHGWFCQGLKTLRPASWRRYVANAKTAAHIGLVLVEQPRPLLKYAAALGFKGVYHPAAQQVVAARASAAATRANCRARLGHRLGEGGSVLRGREAGRSGHQR